MSLMMIRNQIFDKKYINSGDLFVCCIGNEQRSSYLLNQISNIIPRKNILVFTFDSLLNCSKENRLIAKEFKESSISGKYENAKDAQQSIIRFLETHIESSPFITLHIDYSSMPRSWYCRLPFMIESIIRKEDRINFWYVVGEYPDDYTVYPSAGIESFSLFSGRTSLQIDKKRTHVICLSYDTIRTQAILTMLDPDEYIACDAFDSLNRKIHDNVREINAETIAHAIMSISLHTDDFSFMVAKLCEVVRDFSTQGDVILVPDGPKPLIFAMSLVPDFAKLDGVMCLHIARNTQHFTPVNVIPTERIVGFSVEPDAN